MKKFLGKAFKINENEYGRVLLSLLILLLVMSGIVIGRNARDSIFLKNVGIQYLPYMYLLNAFFVVLVSVVYSSVVDKMDRTRFMIVSFILYGGLAVLMRVMLAIPGQVVLSSTICYVIVQIMWLIGLMQFWTYMGDVFDARESKRLFPLISTGGLLGMIAAGLGGKALINAVGGTENLFLVWTGMMGAGIFLIITLSVKYIKKPDPATKKVSARPVVKKSQVQEFKEGFEYLKSSRLLKTMVFINLAMWIVFTIVDYIFNWQVKDHFTDQLSGKVDKDGMTAFLGYFRAGAGFLCLIVQLGFTTRIVASLGVGRTIAIHPTFMVGATAAVAALVKTKLGFLFSSGSKFGDHVLLYTVQDSSYQMLYNPIPIDKRGRARAFVEGYIKPISMGIAGIILIISVVVMENIMKIDPRTSLLIISALSFVSALVWAFFSYRVNSGYVSALTEGLTTPDTRSRIAAISQMNKLNDQDSLKVLLGVLGGGDRDMTLFALEMIESLEAKEAVEEVRAMLGSSDPHIRAAAVSTLSALCDDCLMPSIAEHLGDKSADVRAAAAKAFGRLGDGETLPMIVPLLTDKKRKVRAEAIASLIRAGGLDGILQAGELLKKMLSSEDADDRAHACDVLGRLRVKHFTPTLLQLMADPEPSVRKRAVRAVAKLEDSRSTAALIQALADKRTARYGEKGLLQLKDKALSAMREAAAVSPDIIIRRRCAKVLGRIPGHEAAKTLLELLHDKEPSMRAAVVESLASRVLSPEEKASLKSSISDYIKREMDFIFTQKMAIGVLTTGPEKQPPAIFLDAISETAVQAMDRVFSALSIILDREAVRGIWSKLKSDDPRMKPLALEALDNIGEKEITRRLTPLFEDKSGEDTIAFCRSVLGGEEPTDAVVYTRFASDASPWMRGCAAWAIGAYDDKHLHPILDVLKEDPDPFVRETAQHALKNA